MNEERASFHPFAEGVHSLPCLTVCAEKKLSRVLQDLNKPFPSSDNLEIQNRNGPLIVSVLATMST